MSFRSKNKSIRIGIPTRFDTLGLSRKKLSIEKEKMVDTVKGYPTNLLEIIQEDTFEDPLITASFIEFAVKNEISIAFGKDFEKINKDDLFIDYNPIDINKVKMEDINYYYAYLYQRLHEIIDLYATYDYLLCYAYHLKTASENNFINRKNKTSRRKSKRTAKTIKNKLLTSKSLTMNNQDKIRVKTRYNKTVGGTPTKKYLYEQCDFLAYINRSFWAKISTGIVNAAGVGLSTVGCSIYGPFIYDKCNLFMNKSICDKYTFVQSTTIDSLAASGMLSTSAMYGTLAGIATVGTLSLIQTVTQSSENEILYPRGKVSYRTDPLGIRAVNIEEREDLMETTMDRDELFSELAKFNLCIIHDDFIGNNSVKKFRKIMRDYVINKLKDIFNDKIDEVTAIMKRKVLVTKVESLLTAKSEGDNRRSDEIAKLLDSNKQNLRISEEEMRQIEMTARSKVSGYITDQASYRLETEIRKGISGKEKIQDETRDIKTANQELLPQSHKNLIRDNVIRILASIAHIELENGYVLDRVTINSIVHFYYFYLIAFYLYKNIENPNKSRYDYLYLIVMFIMFLYLLLLTSQNFGFDPINVEEIRKNNTIVDKEKEKIFKTKLAAYRNRQHLTQTANQTTTSTNQTTTSANQTTNASNHTKLTYFETFFDKSSYVESAVKTGELLYDPNITTSIPYIEKQIMDSYTQCHSDAAKSYVSSDMSKRMCELSRYGSKAVNTFYWLRLLMHQTISSVALSDIMLSIVDGSLGSNIKIAFLSTYAGLKYACTKYRTVGSIGCITISSMNIMKNYGDFKSRKKLRISQIETELNPYEFKLDEFKRVIQKDVDEGGGERIKEKIKSLTSALEQMTTYNSQIQSALDTLNVDIGTRVQVAKLGLSERTLEIEEERFIREKGIGDKVGEIEEEGKVGDLYLPPAGSRDILAERELEERFKKLVGPDSDSSELVNVVVDKVKRAYKEENPTSMDLLSICGGGSSSEPKSRRKSTRKVATGR